MPHIAINFHPGRDEERKKEIANKVKDLFVNDLKFPEESISVSFVEIEPDNFVETINKNYDLKNVYIESKRIKKIN